MCAFSTDKQKKGLLHFRFVCFTFHRIFLTQIIIHEFFIHVIFYVTRVISHAFKKALHMLSVLIVQV